MGGEYVNANRRSQIDSDTRQQHDMIHHNNEIGAKVGLASALSQHATRPRRVVHQSFREKVAQDFA